MASTFTDRLTVNICQKKSPLLVGLDPRWEQLPDVFRKTADSDNPADRAAAYREFCREVIDVVAPLVPAVKPQAAFFEQLGPAGMAALANIIQYAAEKDLVVIADGKRGDIGSTAVAYAEAYLGREQSIWGADALTVNPYLGDDSLAPFAKVAADRHAGISSSSKHPTRAAKPFRISTQAAGRFTCVWPNWSIGSQANRSDTAAMVAWARSSGQPIRKNWLISATPCPTPGFWCPVLARKAAMRVTWPELLTSAASVLSSTVRAALSLRTRGNLTQKSSARQSGSKRLNRLRWKPSNNSPMRRRPADYRLKSHCLFCKTGGG